MLFNSYPFILIYLPVVFASFFVTAKYVSHRAAIFVLVVASFLFYAYWDFRYVPLLFASITFNYIVGKQISQTNRRRLWLSIGILVNIMLLGYFKYTNFFLATINDIIGSDYNMVNIILPLGISFYTFTQSAYLIDAYRGEAAKHDFLTYCEFVTIFPHLIAGPIINHKKMLCQFTAKETFHVNIKNVALGLALFSTGLAKKVLIADNLAPIANNVFSRAENLTFFEAWIGSISYTFQLYFDFSGYSEMAIGLGLMFNLTLPMNFNSPYQASSIIEFWRSWHMTLGSWVRDYLYIPMGGNRHGEWKKMRNLFASMLLIGLWHGAGWTFVIWGALHGLLLVINHQWRRLQICIPRSVCWGMTFLCVVACWVIFRSNNVNEAIAMLRAMIDLSNVALPNDIFFINQLDFLLALGVKFVVLPLTEDFETIILKLIILGVLLAFFPNPQVFLEKIQYYPGRIQVLAVVLGLLFAVTLLSIGHVNSEFLYFQF